MTEVNMDVKGKLESAYIVAPFDKGKEALESEGYRIISLEENVGLRIQEGKDSFISRSENWTREGVIYAPKKGIFLTKNSPIIGNAKEATACHRHNSRDYYLSSNQVESALENSVELKGGLIPTNRFKEDKLTLYAFGDIAEEYGQFLRDAGMRGMYVLLADLQDKPFATQILFSGLGYWSSSGLDCKARTLCGENVLGDKFLVRGVRKIAEGTAKNIEARV